MLGDFHSFPMSMRNIGSEIRFTVQKRSGNSSKPRVTELTHNYGTTERKSLMLIFFQGWENTKGKLEENIWRQKIEERIGVKLMSCGR